MNGDLTYPDNLATIPKPSSGEYRNSCGNLQNHFPSSDVHLLELVDMIRRPIDDILHPAALETNLPRLIEQLLLIPRPSIGEHDQISENMTLGMMRIRHMRRQVVQLGRADRTYAPVSADGGRRAGEILSAPLRGVAGGRLEGREPGREGDVQQRAVGDGEEGVVRLCEERGEVVPARLVEGCVDGGAAVARGRGEEAAGALDLVRVRRAEGDEVFPGVGDG